MRGGKSLAQGTAGQSCAPALFQSHAGTGSALTVSVVGNDTGKMHGASLASSCQTQSPMGMWGFLAVKERKMCNSRQNSLNPGSEFSAVCGWECTCRWCTSESGASLWSPAWREGQGQRPTFAERIKPAFRDKSLAKYRATVSRRLWWLWLIIAHPAFPKAGLYLAVACFTQLKLAIQRQSPRPHSSLSLSWILTKGKKVSGKYYWTFPWAFCTGSTQMGWAQARVLGASQSSREAAGPPWVCWAQREGEPAPYCHLSQGMHPLWRVRAVLTLTIQNSRWPRAFAEYLRKGHS